MKGFNLRQRKFPCSHHTPLIVVLTLLCKPCLMIMCSKLMIDFKAFARPRKIRSPEQLLERVMLYCGLDFSLRSCAGEVAQWQGYLSDTAVKKDYRLVFPG